jgi:hypothetical protein
MRSDFDEWVVLRKAGIAFVWVLEQETTSVVALDKPPAVVR